jgi:hypothetical protein
MNKEKLLDYLYDEMTEPEKSAFENELVQDSALKKELEEMQMVRGYLKRSQDEISAPVKLVINRPKVRYLRSRWWTIAASLLVLLIAGKLMNLRISLSDQQLLLSYGPVQSENTAPGELMESHADLVRTVNQLKEQIAIYGQSMEAITVREPANQAHQPDNEILVSMLRNSLAEQKGLENRVAGKILEDQQKYIQAVAQDLIRYWDEQRKNDLRIINEGMQNLVQSIQYGQEDLTQFVNNTYQNY